MELIRFRRGTRCPQRQTARSHAGQLIGLEMTGPIADHVLTGAHGTWR
jgi:hypothetical protein